MDEAQQREIIERLNNLAWYVRKGYPLELHEPVSRGRKGRGPLGAPLHHFKVQDVRASTPSAGT